jgi:hypothetical protein
MFLGLCRQRECIQPYKKPVERGSKSTDAVLKAVCVMPFWGYVYERLLGMRVTFSCVDIEHTHGVHACVCQH